MKKLGYDTLDVIIVSGDAYVDHPAFAASIIGRYLSSLKLKVGIIAQPDWHSTDDFKKMGRPDLFFGVTAGNLDSMLALYTAQRKIRSSDPYSEGNQPGKRPYLPTIVYTNRIREAFKNVPVIIGGIEASLRRIAHYDYYSDKIRPSVLLDSKADLLVYGNGEAPLKEIVSRLKKGIPFHEIKYIRGTVIPVNMKDKASFEKNINLPSFEEVKVSKPSFNKMTSLVMKNLNPYNALPLYQGSLSRGILVNPPAYPLPTEELDKIFELPFTRKAHPQYKNKIPALQVVESSIFSHRGCYGGCSFCTLALHQGNIIQSRSSSSVKNEVLALAKNKNKEITVSNIGGPTANMYGTFCKNKTAKEKCRRSSCIYPQICTNLEISSKPYLKLLKSIRELDEVKAVFINSGIRYDLALPDQEFIDELVTYYTPGQLSVAPEHCSDKVLNIMNKPSSRLYDKFAEIFYKKSKNRNKRQYLMPYFIVGHPGADEKTEKELSNYILKNRIKNEQFQEFIPIPMTLSAAIYYSGVHPLTGEKVYSEKRTGVKKTWKMRMITPQSNKKRACCPKHKNVASPFRGAFFLY